MTVSLTDPLIAPSRITATQVRAWYVDNWGPVPTAVADYIAEAERLCTLVHFDLLLIVAQSVHETSDPDTLKPWTSFYWRTRFNAAGIGITGNDAQNNASQTWANGTDAARGQIVHMAAYTGLSATTWVAAKMATYLPFDQRYTAVGDANLFMSVRVLGDLGNGRWATDPDYAELIAARANDMLRSVKEEPVPTPQQVVEFGHVPKPPIIEMICPKAGPGHGYTEVAPRQNVGICEHITDGHGSIEWYHDFFSIGGERADDALVDFIVGRDGRIGMLNDWRGTRAPWANGNTSGQEGDGPAFIAKFGVAGVNNRLVSIEHEGFAAEDWTGAQWNASIALDAWLFDQMGVRFDSFPVHQNYGVVTHLLHSEFTNKGGNALDECPGRYLKQHITEYQTAIKAVMMAHQIRADVPTPDPKPVPSVPWGRDATGPQQLNDRVALAFLGETMAKRRVPIRYTATSKGEVFATMQKGDKATIRGSVRQSNGTRWALVEINGGVGRAPLSAFSGPWPTT